MAARRSSRSADLFGVAPQTSGSHATTAEGTTRARARARARACTATQQASGDGARGAARRRRRMSAPDQAAMVQRLAQRARQGRREDADRGSASGQAGPGAEEAGHPAVARRRDMEIGSALISSSSAGWATSLRGDAAQAVSSRSRGTSSGARSRREGDPEGRGAHGQMGGQVSPAPAQEPGRGSEAAPTLYRWDDALLAELVGEEAAGGEDEGPEVAVAGTAARGEPSVRE